MSKITINPHIALAEKVTLPFTRLDLVGIPRKSCIFALTEYCSNEDDTNALMWLCSKGEIGKKLWKSFVESQCLGFVEILAMFPSCSPPLQVVLSHLNLLAPRPYSVASSPLVHNDSVIIVFSLVRYTCGLFTLLQESNVKNCDMSRFCIKRSGLCTSYLEDCLRPLLSGIKDATQVPTVPVRVMWKPSTFFRMPGNSTLPLILIGKIYWM